MPPSLPWAGLESCSSCLSLPGAGMVGCDLFLVWGTHPFSTLLCSHKGHLKSAPLGHCTKILFFFLDRVSWLSSKHDIPCAAGQGRPGTSHPLASIFKGQHGHCVQLFFLSLRQDLRMRTHSDLPTSTFRGLGGKDATELCHAHCRVWCRGLNPEACAC